jgi:hypothetical protein
MATLFNTLEYAKGAEKIGIKREHAEYQAQEMAKLIDEQLVTKPFLSGELKSLELTLIKWMIGISFSQVFLLLGLFGFILKH